MKTFIQLTNENSFELPAKFQHDDVRFSESLVEYFLHHYTGENDIVFDPFAGFGTTLVVSEAMNRVGYGIEYDEQRGQFIRSMLKRPENLIIGDAKQLLSYNLPAFDFSLTSPPYMSKGDKEDPLTAYSTEGRGYQAYLQGIKQIYEQLKQLMKPKACVVVEVSNLKGSNGVTTLAWDIAGVVADVLKFEGEVVVGWDNYSVGRYDHSYCMIFRGPD